MAPTPCDLCLASRALMIRPGTGQRVCKPCFIAAFELEIHETITTHSLFTRGSTVAIGASGGKDSTVLASVLKTLNARYDYGVRFILLSIDEGIRGYRDDSLETVRRNAAQYGMELCVLGYEELYGWTMDQVVAQVGRKGNCTYCGVFRRQALDRGAARLGVEHVVTGHNADDGAETVLMNLLRGDLARLARTAGITTSSPVRVGGKGSALGVIRRSKPLKYAFEKEIVLYAHHKKLDYFSTECVYSPEAFRGSARSLIKNLEKVRPRSILDIVKSGEDMALLVPDGRAEKLSGEAVVEEEEAVGACGGAGRSAGGEMAAMERQLTLQDDEQAAEGETDISARFGVLAVGRPQWGSGSGAKPKKATRTTRTTRTTKTTKVTSNTGREAKSLGECSRCGYMSSQAVCKACMLLEGLNKNRPRVEILAVDVPEMDGETSMTAARQLGRRSAIEAS